MRTRGLPYGGTGFKAKPFGSGGTAALLSYMIRLPHDFLPAKGGKLPGLCGGTCNSGGNIPNGFDGFSARLMWGPDTNAHAYLYLPTSIHYGTAVGSGAIRLTKGGWTKIVQEIVLNSVGQSNGEMRIWANDALVIDVRGLTFRHSNDVLIDGVFFEIFYGGNNDSWAAPRDTTIQFAEFSVAIR